MSGRDQPQARLSLLDRLLDEAPEQRVDKPVSAAEALAALRRGVQRDLEALLNARPRWRSLPPGLTELAVSSIGYGIPDFTARVLNDAIQRERLRADIEAAIRRFEPRFGFLRVILLDNRNPLELPLRISIEALLLAESAHEPVAFETLIDTATASVTVRDQGERPDV